MRLKHCFWDVAGAGLSLFLLFLSGCTVGPDYTRPEPNVPGQWSVATLAEAADPAVLQQWWTTFDDASLTNMGACTAYWKPLYEALQ